MKNRLFVLVSSLLVLGLLSALLPGVDLPAVDWPRRGRSHVPLLRRTAPHTGRSSAPSVLPTRDKGTDPIVHIAYSEKEEPASRSDSRPVTGGPDVPVSSSSNTTPPPPAAPGKPKGQTVPTASPPTAPPTVEPTPVPPQTIADLASSPGSEAGTVDLTWTAPAAGSSGPAVAYAVRYAPSPITTRALWHAAASADRATPSPPASKERLTISGLTPGETYYFSVRSQDGSGGWSPLSNCPSAAAAGLPDLGFRPIPNGFGFPNRHFDRTGAMFQQYFGKENVKHPDGSWCEGAVQFFYGSHPDIAISWKGKGYQSVARGWSCLGYSIASLLSYLDLPQPNAGPFAMPACAQLSQQRSSAQLQDAIAYYSGVQTGKQYIDSFLSREDACGSGPDEKIQKIKRGLWNGQPVVASLNTFIGYGWHAVAPYRVEQISPTETDVYVYDSEKPGVPQVIRFRGSGGDWYWEYAFVGSLSQAGAVRGACKDIFLFPVIAALEQGEPPVDFCGSETAESAGP